MNYIDAKSLLPGDEIIRLGEPQMIETIQIAYQFISVRTSHNTLPFTLMPDELVLVHSLAIRPPSAEEKPINTRVGGGNYVHYPD